MRPAARHGFTITLAAIAFAICLAAKTDAAPAIPTVGPHAAAAEAVVLAGPDGTERQLSSLLPDGPAILHFWATWCAPCREELPALAAYAGLLAEDGRGERLVVIAVEPSPPAKIQAFLSELGLDDLKTFRDAQGRSGGVFGLFGMPSTVLIDGERRVVGRLAGTLDWGDPLVRAELEAHLER